MRHPTLVSLLAILATASARADSSTDAVAASFANVLTPEAKHDAKQKAPALSLIFNDVVSGEYLEWVELYALASLPHQTRTSQPVVGTSTGGSSAWIAADFAIVKSCAPITDDATGDASYYQPDHCKREDPKAWMRGAAVLERAGKRWRPVAVHVLGRFGKATADVPAAKLDGSVGKGAEDAVKLVGAALADPKALAAAIADRPDVVMFGSDKGERYVTGAKVKATLARWGLAFAITDQQAGITAAGDVAWVAANVTATKAGAKPSTYRVLVACAKLDKGWQIVQLSFARTVAAKP
ncbi:MAG: nuclear transport factor 2 family protein [Myxococcales bacterium]|nr:nuclear transport factor 2 family protein [Myxococcales bacterium]